jgi:hypothetical protein
VPLSDILLSARRNFCCQMPSMMRITAAPEGPSRSWDLIRIRFRTSGLSKWTGSSGMPTSCSRRHINLMRVFRLWKLPGVVLCSSRYALEEARSNLIDEIQQKRLSELADRLQLFESPDHGVAPQIKLPEKDGPLLLAAREARAAYLLTGDSKYFGAYFGKKVIGIVIMLPAAYLQLPIR